MLIPISIVVFLSFALFQADACSCEAPGNNTYVNFVCEHEFAIRAKVLSIIKDNSTSGTTPNPFNDEHSVKIEGVTVYRNVKHAADPVSIRTFGTGGSCGVDFDENTEYLILGSPSSGNQITTGLCDNNKKWNDLPLSTKKGLESGRLVKKCKPEDLPKH